MHDAHFCHLPSPPPCRAQWDELNFLPILFESGWNWNLKFGFLGQYDQNTIFQTNGQKIRTS